MISGIGIGVGGVDPVQNRDKIVLNFIYLKLTEKSRHTANTRLLCVLNKPIEEEKDRAPR